jgi:hypothetical protein
MPLSSFNMSMSKAFHRLFRNGLSIEQVWNGLVAGSKPIRCEKFMAGAPLDARTPSPLSVRTGVRQGWFGACRAKRLEMVEIYGQSGTRQNGAFSGGE